jgi:hypothetical protein
LIHDKRQNNKAGRCCALSFRARKFETNSPTHT